VKAHAKLNLALVVGPLRADGKHEVATVLQALELHDDVDLEPADALAVEGFAGDTLARAALEALAAAAGLEPRWRARIEKRIPVAAGLGGGSSDAAAALRLANELLREPLDDAALHGLASSLGADVPFFLRGGAQLGTGDGTELEPFDLPARYDVVLVLPHDVKKESTAIVYERFDERGRSDGFEARRAAVLDALALVQQPRDLASLPPNDLATSPLTDELKARGAFRADVTGAGPAVYGLFEEESVAREAARAFDGRGRTWLTRPVSSDD
jgi:4-diphosphocytidyl-2-C-methyl-D-erythritol kinase